MILRGGSSVRAPARGGFRRRGGISKAQDAGRLVAVFSAFCCQDIRRILWKAVSSLVRRLAAWSVEFVVSEGCLRRGHVESVWSAECGEFSTTSSFPMRSLNVECFNIKHFIHY